MKERITDVVNTPCNDLCLNSWRCHCKSPVDAQPLALAFLQSGITSFNFCFSKHIFRGGYVQFVWQLSL